MCSFFARMAVVHDAFSVTAFTEPPAKVLVRIIDVPTVGTLVAPALPVGGALNVHVPPGRKPRLSCDLANERKREGAGVFYELLCPAATSTPFGGFYMPLAHHQVTCGFSQARRRPTKGLRLEA